jgi:hypothetical protein
MSTSVITACRTLIGASKPIQRRPPGHDAKAAINGEGVTTNRPEVHGSPEDIQPRILNPAHLIG